VGNAFVKWLMVAYGIIALAYAWERDWPRVRYFVGAIILSWGVLGMK